MFQCTATGIPAPEISWYRNSNSSQIFNEEADLRVSLSDAVMTVLSNGMIQVSRNLTLSDTVDDSGNYSCQANNTNNSLDIRPFELFVRGELICATNLMSIVFSDMLFFYELHSCSQHH